MKPTFRYTHNSVQILHSNPKRVEEYVLKRKDKVEELYLELNGIIDIAFVTQCPFLITLNFSSNHVKELEFSRNMLWLTHLSFERNYVEDLSPISKFKNLVILKCGWNQIDSLQPICDLRNLIILGCSNNNIGSLEPLKKLKKMSILYTDGNRLYKKKCPFVSLFLLKSLSTVIVDVNDLGLSVKGFPKNVTSCAVKHDENNMRFLEKREICEIHERSGTSKFQIIKVEKELFSWISWINLFDLNKLYDFF